MNSYKAKVVEFVRDVEVLSGQGVDEEKVTMRVGRKVTHASAGVFVTELNDGTMRVWIAVEGGEAYDQIPINAVVITR